MADVARNLRTITTEGLFWGFGGKLVLVAANFAVLVITSRTLTPAEFGIFAAATIFIDLSWVLANSTLGVALIQRKDLTEQELRAGYLGYLVLASAVCALLAVSGPLLERVMRAPGLAQVLFALAALLPLRLLAGFYGAMVQRRLEFRFHQMTQSVPQILGAAATVTGALTGLSVWSLVLGFAVGSVLELGLLCGKAKFTHRLPDHWHSIRPLLQTATGSASQRLLNFAATNVDRFIIGTILGPAALAFYTRAYSLMMVPVKLVGITLSRVLLAVFSTIQDDQARVGRALARVVEAQAVLHLPLGIGLAWSTPLLVHAVLGSAWAEAVGPAQLFFLALVARLGTVPLEAALVGSGRAWTVARLQSAYAVLVAGAASAGALVSAVAVAGGVSLALLAVYTMELFVATRRFGLPGSAVLRWHAKGLALSTFAVAGPASVAFTMRGLDGLRTPGLFEVAAYWFVFAACVLLCPQRIVGEEASRARTVLINRVFRKDST